MSAQSHETQKPSSSLASPAPYTRVALSFPQRRLFDYLSNDLILSPGQRVLVPFANRSLVAVVIEQRQDADWPDEKLKPIKRCLDPSPIIDPTLLKLMKWASNYYHHPLGEVIFGGIPALLRKNDVDLHITEAYWHLSKPSELEQQIDSLKKAKKQRALLEALHEAPNHCLLESTLIQQGFTAPQRKSLAEKGFIHLEKRSLALEDALVLPPAQPSQKALPPSAEQQAAIDGVLKKPNEFHCSLLEGVTGSGKTEVYLQIIAPYLEQGRQALILVPEISLTPQTLARFRARFEVGVLGLHSNLNDRERYSAWAQARKGKAQIIIGTRSAVFTPFKDLAVIIIDEEHDLSFKQMTGFRYSARDIAIARANQLNIPIVLGSATPSLETLKNTYQQRYQHLKLTRRAGSQSVAPLQLLDIRQQPLQEGFSVELLSEIKRHLKNGNQVLVFLNRRGFAPTLMCESCGWVADCPSCSVRLTLHHKPARLHCHHCDYQTAIPFSCPKCQSQAITPLGQGTERSEIQLQQLFPDTEIIRVDRDSTQGKKKFEQLFSRIHEGQPCILVGTQLLAKGHHFPHVTLVAILDADAGLFSADFRGLERMAQLIVQVSGRAGRAEKPGHVIMQTQFADHPILECLSQQGYPTFAQHILEQRKEHRLPPYTFLAILRADAPDVNTPEQWLIYIRQQAAVWLEEHNIVVTHLGPIPAIIEKRAKRFHFQIHFYSDSRKALHQLMHSLTHWIDGQALPKKLRWSVDIDPLDLA